MSPVLFILILSLVRCHASCCCDPHRTSSRMLQLSRTSKFAPTQHHTTRPLSADGRSSGGDDGGMLERGAEGSVEREEEKTRVASGSGKETRAEGGRSERRARRAKLVVSDKNWELVPCVLSEG
eukprot:615062-Rhodomonas_salina.1